jgi:CRISPR system Cascade subunit CasC
MELIEIHMLQSFPVSCLNRDDVGAPKTAVFGGCQRARVSSQCWKRAIRELAADESSENREFFQSKRGHFIAERIRDELQSRGVEEEKAKDAGEAIASHIGKQNTKYKDGHKTEVALFFSPAEISAIATAAETQIEDKGKVEPKKGELAKHIKNAAPKDLADIAIFGRMVASDHTLMVEGAGLFSHAISTHAADNEIDFFSAVDDMKHEEDEGAGHIGTLEFNSACYYRYVGLNVDLLTDEKHLGHFTEDARAHVVRAFLRAAVLAVPAARKNSMFGFNPPSHILGLRRRGQPLSLVNAFEEPVRGADGHIAESKSRLDAHWENLKGLYGLQCEVEATLPPENLDALIDKLVPEA